MVTNFHKTLVIVAIVTTFASGCRSTKEYKKFAEAGNNFVTATDTLLDAASDITINTTSERILSDRISCGEFKAGDEAAQKFIERYDKLSASDKQRLELIKELRKHNYFLQNYFNKLIELADSDSADETKTAVENIVSQLKESGIKLVKLSSVKVDKLPSVTKIVLDARIRGALRDELEKRKFTIYQEITLQEKVLKAISNSIENDMEILRNFQEYRLVVKPIVQSESIDPDTWIQTRYKVMMQDADIISKINNASNTLTKFKGIFIDSIEGDITSKRLYKFIRKTNSFSTLVSEQK